MNLQLNDQQLNEVITKVILDSVSEDQKTQLLESAIKTVLDKANPESHWDKRTKLQVALDGAVAKVADKIANEYVNRPENVERITKVLAEAFEQAFVGENREILIRSVAISLGEHLRRQK